MNFNLDTFFHGLSGSPLPIYCEVQKFLKNPSALLHEMEEAIRIDSLLASRLLREANLKKHGSPGQVDTISHALKLLSMEDILKLAKTTNILGNFQGIPSNIFNMHLYWLHSVATAMAAQTIAELRNEENPERYYVAGLIHDLGKLEICLQTPDQALKIYREHFSGSKPYIQCEEDFLELNHSGIGARFIEKWGLPEFFKEITSGHHSPADKAGWEVPNSVIHLADYTAYSLGLGCGNILPPVLSKKTFQLLNLPPESLQFIRETVHNNLENRLENFL